MGRPARRRPGEPPVGPGEHAAARPGRGAHDRPLGGDVPAHLPDEPREGPPRRRAGVPADRRRRRRAARSDRARRRGDPRAGAERDDRDRRRRHALVRPPPASGRDPIVGDPEDDGQRRPRHRLLHRLLDGREPDGELRPPAADQRRLARAHRRRGGLRPQFGGDVARLGVPLRRRPGGDRRGAVRSRPAGRTPDARQEGQPQQLRDDDDQRGRDPAGGESSRQARRTPWAPQARRDRSHPRSCSRSRRARA